MAVEHSKNLTVEYLCKNAGWMPKEAENWLNLKCASKEVLSSLVNTNTIQYVMDWKKFVKGLKTLIQKPYIKECFGEQPQSLLKVRDALIKLLPADVQEKESPRRIDFSAWALWAHHKSKLYLPANIIYVYVHMNDLDQEDFFKCLRKHATGNKLYTYYELYEAEKNFVKLLESSTSLGVPSIQCTDIDKKQNETISNILGNNYSALQGGAGVGKTTTVSKLIKNILDSPNASDIMVFCLAFTHKAKRCVREKLEAAGIKSPRVITSTIHSFIITYGNGSISQRCFFIIDESSMIDVELIGSLGSTIMQKCVNGYQIACVGDMMQLPPIGRGEPFRVLVESRKSLNELTTCYRTDTPDLFNAYETVRRGKLPNSSEHFELILVDTDKEINSKVGSLIHKYDVNNTKYIAWQNKDVYKINQWVQSNLLKQGKLGQAAYRGFHEKDKVVYIGENVEELTNSLQGQVIKVEGRSLKIRWENNTESNITSDSVNNISLAYCITVHKSQGSEYDNVIVPCYEAEKMASCLDRRWFYTAITRAKKHVIVIGTSYLKRFLEKNIAPVATTSIEF